MSLIRRPVSDEDEPDSRPPSASRPHHPVPDLRRSQAILLPRGFRRRSGLHSHLRISRSRRRTSGRAVRPGFPTHQHYSRCERRCRDGPRIFARKKISRSSGSPPQNCFPAPDPARFRPLLALEADRAREFYQSGDQLSPYISEDSQPALWVLVNIYRSLLEKIAEHQYDVFTGKVTPDGQRKTPHPGEGLPAAPHLM